MTRGYACVGLYQPKFEVNVGSVLRAAGCFDVAMVAISGRRYSKSRTDTQKIYRHIPLLRIDDLHSVVPYDCVPVAVEIRKSGFPLPGYDHPERAFYVFGPEDGSIPKKVLEWCRDVVQIPSYSCLNLAACVNVVLYDRLAKSNGR